VGGKPKGRVEGLTKEGEKMAPTYRAETRTSKSRDIVLSLCLRE